MARINTYERDTDVSGLDLLVGSEFYLSAGVPKYRTKNYSVNDLSTFFGLNSDSINSRLSSYLGVLNEDGSFTYSTAFANQALTTVATAGYASASFVTNLGAIVGTLNADGTLSQLSQAFADQVLNVTSTTRFASTSFATNLASSFGTYNADGSIAVLSSSFADNVFSTMNTSTLASAASVTTLNAELILKPSITRAATAPSIQQEVQNELGAVTTPQSPPNGSMWIDISTTAVTDSSGNVTQQPKNEMYVLAGSAGSVAWTLTKDASLLNTVTSLATAEQSLTTVSDAQSATATFATGLASNFGTVNGLTGALTFSEGFANQVLTTTSNARFAESSFVTNLASTFGSTDADGNLTINSSFADSVLSTQTSGTLATAQSVTDLTSTVNLKPNIFRQASVPTALAAKDVWFDSDDDNKIYVATALGNNAIASNQWVLTTDPRVTHSFTYTSDATESMGTISTAAGASATKITNLAADYGSFDGSGNFTPGLSAAAGAAITATVNAAGAAATAVNSLNASLKKVITATSQPAVNDVNIPVGSIWVDTSTGKNYILTSGSPNTWNHTTDATMASVTEVSDAIAGVNGKLTSRYGMKVAAGGVFAGMELLATSGSDPNTDFSSIAFTASSFKIYTISGSTVSNVAPFSVSGNTVSINGNLQIGGTAASTVASNAATGSTALQPGNAATDVNNNTTTISGNKIRAGSIQSNNYSATGQFASNGMLIDLSTGLIRSKNFFINSDGSTYFKGDISGASGSFSGTLALTSSGVERVTITASTSLSTLSSGTSMSGSHVDGRSTVGVTLTSPGSTGGGTRVSLNTGATTITGQAGKRITIQVTTYGARIRNSTTLGSGATASASFGVGIYGGYAGAGAGETYFIAESSDFQDVSRSSSGYSASTPTRTFFIDVDIPSNTYYLEARPIIKNSSRGVTGTSGQTTWFYFSQLSSASYIFAPEKVEINSGGLMVSKSAQNFFKVDRNVSSSQAWGSNFIHSKMYAWKHEGRLGVLDAVGSGDIVVGQMGASGTGDYLRIHSTTGDKFIDYQGGNLQFRAGSSEKATLTSAGVWSSDGGGTSDIRKKKYVEYITNDVTELLKQLRPVKFKFKNYSESQRRGFIAQDVLGVMPDLVLGDGDVEGGTYGLDYDGILALVVKGFKEQQTLIESQKTLIDNLTQRVTTLEG